MTLSIIIVNWNSMRHVRGCLVSIDRHCSVTSREVVVVDSGSFDGCEKMIAEEFPWVRYVQSADNVGFAKANNIGFRASTGSYILFLNPDTELIEDCIPILMRTLVEYPEAGAVGCRLLNADMTLQTSCVQSFPTVLNQVIDSDWLRARFPKSSLWGTEALTSESSEPSAVEALSGACILMRRETFGAIGGFNESYFMYAEDMDLCWKVRQSGHEVVYVPTARLVHFGGGSSGKAPGSYSNVMMRASVCRFIRLRQGVFAAGCYRMGMAMSALARIAVMVPLSLFGKRVVRHGNGSFGKWSAILRWSIRPDIARVP